jgi:hypothetical protein
VGDVGAERTAGNCSLRRALVYERANNIYAHPNDTIFLYNEPQTYLPFGALGSQQQIPFTSWRMSLAEAISKAGGLVDGAANPAAVFLYRGETREVAEAMGVDCSPFEGPIIPIIYNINLRDPAGYFLARTFEMRNKDVIYVSNSELCAPGLFLEEHHPRHRRRALVHQHQHDRRPADALRSGHRTAETGTVAISRRHGLGTLAVDQPGRRGPAVGGAAAPHRIACPKNAT